MEAQKCEGIKRGEGMNIYDIAAEAGTSISTVSVSYTHLTLPTKLEV